MTFTQEELDLGRIRTVRRFLEEFSGNKAVELSANDRRFVATLAEEAAQAKAQNETEHARILLLAFEDVNRISGHLANGRAIAPEDQKRMVARLEGCLSAFETEIKGVRARLLLEAAGDRTWSRAEFREAEGYVIQFGE